GYLRGAAMVLVVLLRQDGNPGIRDSTNLGTAHLIQHAFGELGLHRLEANIQPDNTPSLALVKRLGFEREGYSTAFQFINGEWRDHERWAITAETAGKDTQPAG
ncbi:GNAT family N-acetyltransferase, partial [Streptomyces hygroscopicus]|uniref:GNAT family N-acetyltransferase n=1 Tax=Streptomyces hygroscopicus TaxID=1912 RepID=UPI00367842B9